MGLSRVTQGDIALVTSKKYQVDAIHLNIFMILLSIIELEGGPFRDIYSFFYQYID